MPRYNISNGTLPRERQRVIDERAATMLRRSALPAPVRAEFLNEHLQPMEDADLVAVLSGGIDFEAVLRKQLSDRGLNIAGVWVGFAEAEQLFDRWFATRPYVGCHQGFSK